LDETQLAKSGLSTEDALKAASEENTRQKESLKSVMFPRDLVPYEDDESEDEAAALAVALEAARLERKRYAADLKYRRSRLESEYELKLRNSVHENDESPHDFLDSFYAIVENIYQENLNNGSETSSIQGVKSSPTKSRSYTSAVTTPTGITPKKKTSTLKEVANAQCRRRIAKRRELEKDATLAFLASR
jgi:hypothetical protein